MYIFIIKYLILYVVIKIQHAYVIDCGNETSCRCDYDSGTINVICSIEETEVFDFRQTDLWNITHLEVKGSSVIVLKGLSARVSTTLKSLYVQDNRRQMSLLNGFLQQFPNIEHLRLRNCNLTNIHVNAFKGLTKFRSLDLSRNGDLAYDVVENALAGLNSYDLELLNLSSIHNPTVPGKFPFGRISFRFLEVLSNTSLEVLDISWSQARVFEGDAKYIPNLRSFNFSGTDLAFIPACVTSFFSLQNLTEIIMDYWPYTGTGQNSFHLTHPRYKLSLSPDQCHLVPFFKDGCYQFPTNLRTLQARYSQLSASSLLIDFAKSVCVKAEYLTNLILSGTVLPSSFVSIEGIDNLQVFDLSYPVYDDVDVYFPAIYSNFFHLLPSLTVILIPGNYIHTMNDTELINLFPNNIYLEVLDISSNRLKHIPDTMFIGNTALRHINISRNELKTFTTDLSNLLYLETLDLSQNKLISIYLDSINKIMLNELFLSNNLFPCDCSINNIQKINVTELHMTCLTRDNLVMTVNQTESYSFQCFALDERYAPFILHIVIPCVSVLVVIVVLFLFIKCRQRARSNPGEKQLQNTLPMPVVHFIPAVNPEIQQRNPSFLAFIAYSHFDSDLVCSDIVPKLEEALQRLLPDHKDDILCLYDKHFLPGDGIDEACEQAVLNSHVLVAIITKSFLNSGWCSFELKQAITRQIPIIPLYLVACDPNEYCGIFKVIFEEKIRLNWPEVHCENGKSSCLENEHDSIISPKTNKEMVQQEQLAYQRDIIIQKLAAAIYSNVKNQMSS